MKTKDMMIGFALVALVGAKAGRAEEEKYVVSCSQRDLSHQTTNQLSIYKNPDGKYAYHARTCQNFPFTPPCSSGDTIYGNSGEVEADIYDGHLTGLFKNEDIRTYFICGRQFIFRDESHRVGFMFQPQECSFSFE